MWLVSHMPRLRHSQHLTRPPEPSTLKHWKAWLGRVASPVKSFLANYQLLSSPPCCALGPALGQVSDAFLVTEDHHQGHLFSCSPFGFGQACFLVVWVVTLGEAERVFNPSVRWWWMNRSHGVTISTVHDRVWVSVSEHEKILQELKTKSRNSLRPFTKVTISSQKVLSKTSLQNSHWTVTVFKKLEIRWISRLHRSLGWFTGAEWDLKLPEK